MENGGEVKVLAEPPPYRTYDGSLTDPDHPSMGKTGTRFGRNMPVETTYPQEQSMLDPGPPEVSTHLLNRDSFKPATTRSRWERTQLGRRDDGGQAHEP